MLIGEDPLLPVVSLFSTGVRGEILLFDGGIFTEEVVIAVIVDDMVVSIYILMITTIALRGGGYIAAPLIVLLQLWF